MPNSALAPVAILATNRPDHLAALLESLLNQDGTDLARRRVFLFLDDGTPANGAAPLWSDAVRQANLEQFRQMLPRGIALAAEVHLGPAQNRDRAESLLFETWRVPAAIVLSDRMVLGRHYLVTMDRLLAWALADARIGYVAAEGDPRATSAEQRADPGRMIALRDTQGYGVVRRQWVRQRRFVVAYLARRRAGTALPPLFQEWGLAGGGTSVDAAVACACVLTGAARLNTFAAFARSLEPVRNPCRNGAGFDGPALIDDDLLRLAPSATMGLPDLLAAQAAALCSSPAWV